MLTDDIALTTTTLLTKAAEWSYEHEYRTLPQWRYRHCAHTTISKTNSDYLELPADTITRIIVGTRGDLDKTKRLVGDCQPDLAVEQARISEHEYKVIVL